MVWISIWNIDLSKKNLNYGDYLIDDRLANGADLFKGEHIHFGSDKFPNWESVCSYLL